jgi:hypothetical protein
MRRAQSGVRQWANDPGTPGTQQHQTLTQCLLCSGLNHVDDILGVFRGFEKILNDVILV